MARYSVKEIFYTLQCEGYYTGRPAVFCRFTGCNLWSGREQDRAQAACSICDTDFIGTAHDGGVFLSAYDLAERIAQHWPETKTGQPYVVFTGGEPLLQLDEALIDAVHARSFEVGVETNGTIVAPKGIDWLCVSPKPNSTLKQRSGNELKLVYPQEECAPETFELLAFTWFYLQPLAHNDQCVTTHIQSAHDYCLSHPKWRLSLQIHKLLGLR